MRRFILRISIFLIIIISIPISFLIIRQLSDLTKNEKIVKGVFEKQIETILYSLNQTSDNIITSWINRIDLPLDYNSEANDKIVNFLFENNQAINKIEFIDLNQGKTLFKSQRVDSIHIDSKIPEKGMIEELRKFLEDGYQRIDSRVNEQFTILYFLSKNRGKDVLGVIYIKTKTFIEQNLGPNIQQVAQESFNIKVTNIKDGKILYSFGPVDEDLLDSHTQTSWYLPGIEFSIQLRSATIDSLVRERSKRENYIFAGVLLIVLFGILFVIISIRKEIFLSEMKSEFVSNVSHEIRTPLALISMYAETLLLKRLKTPEKETEYLNVVHLEAQRLSEMVNRILTFSKMEKHKRTYHLSEIDLNGLIEEVIYSYSPHLKLMNVSYNLDLEPDLPFIYADRESIFECMINILDNAVKYGRDTDKKIVIRTSHIQQNVRIDLEDNGIGIAKKHQRHIFEKFYRVTKGNLAHKAKGTGLGLNIVKQIMENQGGSVKVKSVLDEGSCFSLIFPLSKK
jgi:two-component system, OmpR family, phosphate regulon sensor histidine kinase PhoR